MSASFTAQLLISRIPDPGDPKGAWGPRTYAVTLGPGLIDQEIVEKIAPGAMNVTVAIPAVGSNTQLVLISTDNPGLTYTRNSEVVVNPMGKGGVRLEVGAPSGSPALTQLVFSNPTSLPITVYILVGGM